MESLSREEASQFEFAGTATISTVLYKRGLKSIVLTGLAPIGRAKRFVGVATTVRFVPSREDRTSLAFLGDPEYPQRKAIETARTGQVVVFACGGGRSGMAGSILLSRLQVLGASAFVTDGAVRDSSAINSLDLPVFASAISPWMHLVDFEAVEMNTPVGCAGVQIRAGDVLVGDEDGVVCVPRELAFDVGIEAAEQAGDESQLLERVQHGAPLRGTYPPDESTLAEIRATRAKKPE